MKGAISLIKKVWINPWKKGREIRSVLARWKNTFKKRIKTEKSYQTKEMMRHCYVLLYQYDSQQIYFMKFGSLLHFSPWQMNLQLNWRGSRFSTPNIQSMSVTDSFFFSFFGHRKSPFLLPLLFSALTLTTKVAGLSEKEKKSDRKRKKEEKVCSKSESRNQIFTVREKSSVLFRWPFAFVFFRFNKVHAKFKTASSRTFLS